ncbi:MAG: hypothetical protein N3C57_01370, partial [Aquificaceae bacterium]|nr:hypothetical protein [Aquificaceae bacterium]
SRVYKTAIIQAFYGVGLYTVRGGVNATYSGGLLSGCYYEANPQNNCFVPAFIASAGNVNLGGATQRSCGPTPPTNPGVYGTPPVFSNAQFTDLTPLFFNVNCFASNFFRNAEACNYGLTDALVDTYSLRYRDNQPDFTFSPHGEPVINQTLLLDLQSNTQVTPQGPPNCRVTVNQNSINLNNLIATLNPLLGGQAGLCQSVEIYTNSDLTLTGTPPIQTTIFMRGNATTGTLLVLNGVNGTITGTTNFGENVYNLRIYSARPVRIDANSSRFRLVTTNQVTTGNNNITITEATIVQALTDNEQNNDPASPQNFIAFNGTGTLTITDSKLITRQVRFGVLNAHRDLFYLYANACPNCSRATNTASVDACRTDMRRCGWAPGLGGGGLVALTNDAFFGTDQNRNIQDAQGRMLVSLLINNNSVVAGRRNFFGGIYFGQDVNYILRAGGEPNVVRGFFVRNFPQNLSLDIGFDASIDFQFRLDAINNLRFDHNRVGFQGFWFIKRVTCVREDPTPAYMSIITRMTSW